MNYTSYFLHMVKFWFAAKASNWELSQYELNELKETMEAVKGLNAEKNGVKVSTFWIPSFRLRLLSWPKP